VRDVATWMVSPMAGYGVVDNEGDGLRAEPSGLDLLAVREVVRRVGVILGAAR
jgi:hypothetical protein